MTVLFLANVGSSDIRLSDPSLLPPDLQDRKHAARLVGDAILTDFDRYADALQFPLIGVCLAWLLEREGISEDDLHIHLFASDQEPPPITPEAEYSKDSLPFARVIERYLIRHGVPYTYWRRFAGRPLEKKQRLRLPSRQIHIHPIEGNPADYGNMLETFTRELSSLRDHVGVGDRTYLEVTGGTPAMTSMLTVAGVDVFARQTRTLYVERGADRPYAVGIGRRFFARQAQAALREQLRVFAYGAARAAVDREGDLIATDVEDQALIRALLEYADRRLAFDFERAREALHRASAYAAGRLQAHIRHRQRELARRDSAALLGELTHSTRVKYQLGDHADFTQRIFRFQEGCFRHLSESMGLQYRKQDERYADPQWQHRVPGLRQFLEDYTSPLGEKYGPIDLDRWELNRISLGAIVDFFVARGEPWAHLVEPVRELHRLSSVAHLRNRGLAGRGFEGIGRSDLEDAFGQNPNQIVPLVEEIYEAIFTAELGENPYEALNQLILSFLRR